MPDAPSNGKPLDKLLAGLDAMMAKVDSLSARMDGIEKGRAKAAAVNDEDEDLAPLPPDNEDGKALGEEGRPVPVAADGGLNAARARRAKLAGVQARHDSVAQKFGEQALPALQGETVGQYRRRLLRPLQKYSQTWKGVDLDGLGKPTLDIAERDILLAASDEAQHPKVPRGFLMERKTSDGKGHFISTFHGSMTWLDRHRRPVRFVERINLRPMQGITT
jgi:hypothetical protein